MYNSPCIGFNYSMACRVELIMLVWLEHRVWYRSGFENRVQFVHLVVGASVWFSVPSPFSAQVLFCLLIEQYIMNMQSFVTSQGIADMVYFLAKRGHLAFVSILS